MVCNDTTSICWCLPTWSQFITDFQKEWGLPAQVHCEWVSVRVGLQFIPVQPCPHVLLPRGTAANSQLQNWYLGSPEQVLLHFSQNNPNFISPTLLPSFFNLLSRYYHARGFWEGKLADDILPSWDFICGGRLQNIDRCFNKMKRCHMVKEDWSGQEVSFRMQIKTEPAMGRPRRRKQWVLAVGMQL